MPESSPDLKEGGESPVKAVQLFRACPFSMTSALSMTPILSAVPVILSITVDPGTRMGQPAQRGGHLLLKSGRDMKAFSDASPAPWQGRIAMDGFAPP